MAEDHRTLHQQAIEHLTATKAVIDKLKLAGPHPLDGDNAILNIAERAAELMFRAGYGAEVAWQRKASDAALAKARNALEEISALGVHQRVGGADPEDLEEIDDALSEAIHLADEALNTIKAENRADG